MKICSTYRQKLYLKQIDRYVVIFSYWRFKLKKCPRDLRKRALLLDFVRKKAPASKQITGTTDVQVQDG